MSHRKETEAMDAEHPIEDWTQIPWRKLERKVYRLQKRIYQASLRGNDQAVHNLQRLLMKSKAARTLAVRRVTQENQGKQTAGVDGVKSVKPAQRLALAHHLRHHKKIKPLPTRRVWIPKPGKGRKSAVRHPDMGCTLPFLPGDVRDSMCRPPGGPEHPIHHASHYCTIH